MRDSLAALAGGRPLVLLLEDLHWADPASLDLLRTLAPSLGALPLLLLATYRPEDIARDHPLYALLPTLVREARPLRLDLPPLPEEDLRALVAARYRLPPHDAARLAAWLRARSEGNPFYAEELLRGLEEEGVLRPLDAGWALGDPALASLPPLLRQLIDGRVARLGQEAQRALAAAAVIGQEVPLALWSAVGGAAEDDLLAVLAAAEAARLLAVSGDGTAVCFAHALIREALYAGTPAVQRRTWHQRAARRWPAGPARTPTRWPTICNARATQGRPSGCCAPPSGRSGPSPGAARPTAAPLRWRCWSGGVLRRGSAAGWAAGSRHCAAIATRAGRSPRWRRRGGWRPKWAIAPWRPARSSWPATCTVTLASSARGWPP